MPYNWKCCSLYPNNFGASALIYKGFKTGKVASWRFTRQQYLAIPCLATSTNNNVKVENKSRYCSLFSEIVYIFARFKKASV